MPPKPGAHPQEILSRPEDDPRLSEDDKKIIAICREYPDEMERVVFGGGMSAGCRETPRSLQCAFTTVCFRIDVLGLRRKSS